MVEIRRIELSIGGLMVVPPLPAGRHAIVGDDHEEEAYDDDRDDHAGLSFFITYSGGSLSERRITIKSLRIEGAEVRHISAFCHERRAMRLFRIDRLQEAVDISTGEVLSASDLCHALRNRGIPVAEQRLAAIIRILVFMARCDGAAHHLEWDEIDRSIVRLSRCLVDDDDGIEELCADARRLAPDGQDFIRALKSLTRTRLPARLHQELRRAIGAIIEADGWQHDEEIRWGMEAMDYISRMPATAA